MSREGKVFCNYVVFKRSLKEVQSEVAWKCGFSYFAAPCRLSLLHGWNNTKLFASSEITSSVPGILHKFSLFCHYLWNGRLLLYFACINEKPFTSLLLSQTLGSGVLKSVLKVTPVGQRRNCTHPTAYKTHPLCLLRDMLTWELNWVCAPQQLLQQKMHLSSVSREFGSH